MSFSAEWLALREPADHAAVDRGLRGKLAAHFAGRERIAVVDLGCGAGSNLRGCYDLLPADQAWTLVDYDPALLLAARGRLAAWADEAIEDGGSLRLAKADKRIVVSFRQADLAAGYPQDLFSAADLITAAALFDIVSVGAIAALAKSLGPLRRAFYTVLTYDGVARFAPPHDADAAVLQAFNAHQTTDKGFGPAAGPRATQALAEAFEAQGYGVGRGSSPWVLDEAHAALRRELDAGFAAAAREAGLQEAMAGAWLAHRLSGEGRVTTVGHEDLLAIPAA